MSKRIKPNTLGKRSRPLAWLKRIGLAPPTSPTRPAAFSGPERLERRSLFSAPAHSAPSAATQLVITSSPPAEVVAGTPFDIAVAAEDPQGNVDSNFSGKITLSINYNNTALQQPDLIGYLMVNAIHGVAFFSDITTTAAFAQDTLHAAAPGLVAVDSVPFDVAPAPAASLFLSIDQGVGGLTPVIANGPLVVSVTGADFYGNIAPVAGSVSIAMVTASSNAMLSGTLNVAAQNGAARFTDLSVSQFGQYTLVATDGALTGQLDFTVQDRLLFTAEPPANLIKGTPFELVVSAQDAMGNFDPAFNGYVTVSAYWQPGSVFGFGYGAFPIGGVLTIKAIGGIASFSGLTVSATGSRQLTAYGALAHRQDTRPFNVTNTATTLSLSPASVDPGVPITLSASVVGTGVSPTGTVVFEDASGPGVQTLGTGTLNASGDATFAASPLGIGYHQIFAAYTGQNDAVASSSNVKDLSIGTDSQRYVNQLYADLFMRNADPAGLASWAAALDAGQNRTQVATAIASSREYDGTVVDGFYVRYLKRHAEPDGLSAWIDRMQAGLNAQVIRAGILSSQEYFDGAAGAGAPATDTTYVTALYQTFLNRAPDAAGLAAWLGVLKDPSDRTLVATGISDSDENRTQIITGFYQAYLHRDPDAAGLAGWKQSLASGISQPQIIVFFVTSEEYLSVNHIN